MLVQISELGYMSTFCKDSEIQLVPNRSENLSSNNKRLRVEVPKIFKLPTVSQ